MWVSFVIFMVEKLSTFGLLSVTFLFLLADKLSPGVESNDMDGTSRTTDAIPEKHIEVSSFPVVHALFGLVVGIYSYEQIGACNFSVSIIISFDLFMGDIFSTCLSLLFDIIFYVSSKREENEVVLCGTEHQGTFWRERTCSQWSQKENTFS